MNNVMSCPAGSLRYVWRNGDTLARVSAAFGTTISAMIDVNPGINFQAITEGTTVCVPSRQLTCPNSDLYVIQSGDTLSAIAARYGISTLALMELNPYVEPTHLAIGQYICVPKTNPSQSPEDGSMAECPIPAEPVSEDASGSIQSACAASDTVKCGQTLYDILVRYGITYQEFASLNPRLCRGALVPGQKYWYPLRACACPADGKYVWKAGDTASSVAASVGITASELMRRNPGLKPDELTEGREICLTYSGVT